jgi:hypothetical protein
VTRRAWHAGVLLTLTLACAASPQHPGISSVSVPYPFAPSREVRADTAARFWDDAGTALGHPPADSLLNENGSPRITDDALYERFWRDVAPSLSRWSADPRLRVNPDFVAALIAKESGFDPLATSDAPANGIAQLTHVADLDLRIITRDAPAWHWMYDEVRKWPRSPLVHDSLARKARTDSLVAAGTLDARTEYLFDPTLSTRAAIFWLRVLAQMWTDDSWPGRYGSMARARLSGGGPLPDSDLLSLVTVSYNQGHPYVAGLVQQYGRDWERHLNAEAADYLERIRDYTAVFQRAAGGR